MPVPPHTYMIRVSREIGMVIEVEADNRHEAEQAAIDWFDGHLTLDSLDDLETLTETMDGTVQPDIRLERKTKSWWEPVDA